MRFIKKNKKWISIGVVVCVLVGTFPALSSLQQPVVDNDRQTIAENNQPDEQNTDFPNIDQRYLDQFYKGVPGGENPFKAPEIPVPAQAPAFPK